MSPQHLVGPLLGLFLAPLVVGVINRIKALVAGRRGPPLVQPYRDVFKLLRRGAVYGEGTTPLVRLGPVLNVATLIAALAIVPFPGAPAAISFTGDLIVLVGLLALGRFATVLAALDTGSSFEGMGASREVHFAALAEPALFLSIAALALARPGISWTPILAVQLASWHRFGPALAMLIGALLLVTLAENSRIPFDDPNTHLELTMVHEVMILDHSGPAFGVILYGAALKLFVFAALIVRLAVPWATGVPWLDW